MNLSAQIFEQLDDANRAAAQHLAIGREQGQREGKAARDALRAIVYAYDACQDDEAHRIGTPLMCAIEAARRVL